MRPPKPEAMKTRKTSSTRRLIASPSVLPRLQRDGTDVKACLSIHEDSKVRLAGTHRKEAQVVLRLSEARGQGSDARGSAGIELHEGIERLRVGRSIARRL